MDSGLKDNTSGGCFSITVSIEIFWWVCLTYVSYLESVINCHVIVITILITSSMKSFWNENMKTTLRFEEFIFNVKFWSHVRSSRPKVFCKKGVLRNFTKFTGKHLCLSLFFVKFLRAAFYIEHLRWLFLTCVIYSTMKLSILIDPLKS